MDGEGKALDDYRLLLVREPQSEAVCS